MNTNKVKIKEVEIALDGYSVQACISTGPHSKPSNKIFRYAGSNLYFKPCYKHLDRFMRKRHAFQEVEG